MKTNLKSNQGFTLIELLVSIVIVGVLATLAVPSFAVYRAKAAYTVCARTVRDGRGALEGAHSRPDVTLPAVPLTSQSAQGGIQDPTASAILPGMQLPANVKFQVSYDPTCDNGGCQAEVLQVNHCFGKEYVRWIRYGDGLDVLMENQPGPGCT